MEDTITLEQTCECYPEQYWVYKGSHIIGYIRLRWGHLTCNYLPKGTFTDLTDNGILVYDKIFNDDNFKGSFDTEEEREYWLSKCKEALLDKYNELK